MINWGTDFLRNNSNSLPASQPCFQPMFGHDKGSDRRKACALRPQRHGLKLYELLDALLHLATLD
jgi:hypothetical protein